MALRHQGIAVSVALIAGAGTLGWWLLKERPAAHMPAPVELTFAQEVEAAKQSNAAGLSSTAEQAANQQAQVAFSKKYENDALGFAFLYPPSMNAGAPQDSDGNTTVLIQSVSSSVGFQVYVSRWSDPDTSITPERVKADLQDIELRSPQEITVDGTAGLAFLAEDPAFGDSRQVWFIHKGHLYQVSTYSSQDALLEKVLGTWAFRN